MVVLIIDDLKRSIRSQRIIKAIAPYIKKDDIVLDIGCGNGKIGELIKNRFNIELYSVDTLYYDDVANFKKIRNNTIPYTDKFFDVSIINDVLHHIDYPFQIDVIKEALRVSKVVLIYELSNSITNKLVDIITNKMNDRRVYLPLSMRSLLDWIKLFNSHDIICKYHIIKREPDQLYLLKNYLFVLENQRS